MPGIKEKDEKNAKKTKEAEYLFKDFELFIKRLDKSFAASIKVITLVVQ